MKQKQIATETIPPVFIQKRSLKHPYLTIRMHLITIKSSNLPKGRLIMIKSLSSPHQILYD